MKNMTIDKIKNTIRDLPEGEQEVILYLAEIFKGEEDKILEYCISEFINVN